MDKIVYSEEIRLSIGGITVSIRPEDGIVFGLGSAHKFFLGGGEPDLRLGLRRYNEDAVGLKSAERSFESGGIWDLYRREGSYIFNSYNDDFGKSPYKTAVVDEGFASGDIYLNTIPGDDRPAYPFDYPLDEMLMVHMLSSGKGIMIHGCGIVVGGKGFLFAGTSGRGKSTISDILRKEAGAVILNDDRTIVRRSGAGYNIYGTPWHGDVDECSNSTAPLKRIFFIRHADENYSNSLQAPEAAAQLVARSFSPMWDKDLMWSVLDFASDIADKIPSFELGFVPDRTIAQFLHFI